MLYVRPHNMRSAVLAVLEYIIGFIALAFFAYLAFARGASSDESFVFAFKASSILAVVELAYLLRNCQQITFTTSRGACGVAF